MAREIMFVKSKDAANGLQPGQLSIGGEKQHWDALLR